MCNTWEMMNNYHNVDRSDSDCCILKPSSARIIHLGLSASLWGLKGKNSDAGGCFQFCLPTSISYSKYAAISAQKFMKGFSVTVCMFEDVQDHTGSACRPVHMCVSVCASVCLGVRQERSSSALFSFHLSHTKEAGGWGRRKDKSWREREAVENKNKQIHACAPPLPNSAQDEILPRSHTHMRLVKGFGFVSRFIVYFSFDEINFLLVCCCNLIF